MRKYKNRDNTREYKNILITKENYEVLKKLGQIGESFNLVVTKLLNTNKTLQSGHGIPAPNQIATE